MLYDESRRDSILEGFRETLKRLLQTPFGKHKYGNSGLKINSFDDIEKIPFTLPEEINAWTPEERCAVPVSKVARVLATSGTGENVKLFSYSDRDLACSEHVDQILELGLPREGYLLNLTPEGWGGGGLLASSMRTAGLSIVNPPVNMLAEFLPVLFRRIKFSVIQSLPSKLARLARGMIEKGNSPAGLGVKAIVSIGEVVSEWLIKFLEETFQAPFFNFYGSIDTGPIANGRGNTLTLYDENYCEIIDSELVVSTLKREASPLLRYRPGDVVEVVEKGRRPLIRFRGRTKDRLKGNIFAVDFEEAIFTEMGRVADYLIIRGNDGIKVQLEFESENENKKCGLLSEKLGNLVGERVEVIPVEKGVIPPSPGKYRRIASSF